MIRVPTRIDISAIFMSKLVKLNDTGFNNMIGHLRRGTGASLKDVTKVVTGSILQNSARNTGKASYKKIVADVDKSLSRTFKSSTGVKIRKGKDGSLIVNSPAVTNNKWVKVRNNYETKAISGKTPAGRSFSKKQTSAINKSLGELRKKRTKTLKAKKKNIASGQSTFIYMLRKLRIKIKSARGIGAALKVKLPLNHTRALSARETNVSRDEYIIILKSKSMAALNPYANGTDAFRKSFNSQVKGFNIAAKKNMKAFTKKFANKNGFKLR